MFYPLYSQKDSMISFSQLLQKQFHMETICLDKFVNTLVREWDTKQVFAKKKAGI